MKWTIKNKMKAMAAGVFLGGLVMFVVSYFSLRSIEKTNEVLDIRIQQSESLAHLKFATTKLTLHSMDLIIDSGGEMARKEELVDELNKIKEEISTEKPLLMKMAQTDEEKLIAGEMLSELDEIEKALFGGLIPSVMVGDYDKISLYDDKIDEHADVIAEDLEKIMVSVEAKVDEAHEAMNSSITMGQLLGFIIFIITAVSILSIFYVFGNSILIPINKLAGAADDFASGKNDVEVNYNKDDELGALATSFNLMIEKISQQIAYLDNLPTPVMIVDTEMTVQYMNKYGTELLGRKGNECSGEKCFNLFKTDHCNTSECRVKQAMEQNTIRGGETISHAGANDMHILYTGAPVHDKQGNVIGGMEYVADITEGKEMQNYLRRSTECMMNAMDKFAAGDLTVQADCEKTGDDMSRLFESFNKSVESIRNMINKVNEAVEATASASSEISSSTEQMAAGAQEQSAQTHEVATAIEQMSATILETAQSSNNAASSSKDATSEANSGVMKIDATKKGMMRIVDSARGTSRIIKELNGKTDQIGEIAQVIDDIADQTNLLALNAAIEAARAGEQGRGFAVVADEVRKLAERTTKATKEIAETIKAIQTDVREADDSMNEAGVAVNDGMKLTEEVAEVFTRILKKSDEVSQGITQVASASEEQSVTAEQVSKNIESITNVTNESAAAIQQVAATAEDLNRLTLGLTELISSFKVRHEEVELSRKKVNFELVESDYSYI